MVIFLFILSIIYKEFIISFLSPGSNNYLFPILFFFSFALEFIPQYISAHILLINLAILDIPLFHTTAIIVIGSFVGSIFGFEVGRKISQKAFEKEELKKIKDYISKYGKFFMALASISPLPYFPIIFGFLRIKRVDFLLFGLVPRAGGIILLGFLLGVRII